MALTIADEIRQAFHLAAMRKEAQDIRTPDDWARANRIVSQAGKLRFREEQLFVLRYDARVEAAMKRLIHDAAKQRRDLKPFAAGADRFDKTGLLLQAQREVRDAHANRLQKIARAELRLLDRLVEKAWLQTVMHGRPKDAFAHVADRRSGQGRCKRTGPTMQ